MRDVSTRVCSQHQTDISEVAPHASHMCKTLRLHMSQVLLAQLTASVLSGQENPGFCVLSIHTQGLMCNFMASSIRNSSFPPEQPTVRLNQTCSSGTVQPEHDVGT